MGQRDASVSSRRKGSSHARNDLKGYFIDLQLVNFFAATSEYEGIATFEADDLFTFDGTVYKDLFDLILWYGVTACAFTHVDSLAIWFCPIEYFGVGEIVVNDDISKLDELARADSNESGIARACSN